MQRTHCLSLFLMTMLPACAVGPADSQDENLIAPAGKEDNFFSNTAQEYLATATVPLELEASYAERSETDRLERARLIMEGRTKQIGWFLHLFLIDKSSDHGNTEADYGGVRAMVLEGSYESDALKVDPENPLRYSFAFSVQVGGTKELLSKIRAKKNLSPDATSFPLDVARLGNSSVVSFSHSAYSAGKWSPESCNCELEKIDVKLEPIPASNDAYLHYDRYLEDGIIDISIHVGWDYHARYDITHSRTLYEWLVGAGFTSPAESYEKYNRLSGPLKRKLVVNGRDIEARVTIFRPDPCVAWDEDGSSGKWAEEVKKDESYQKRRCADWAWGDPNANANSTTDQGAGNLMADLKASLKTRDAVIFTGHSGYTYGYALANWYTTSRGDLDPPEIKTLDLPRTMNQLFVMSGCDTYHVAQAFRDNPNKQGLANVDVVTTTSFSNAGDVGDTQDLLRALAGDDGGVYSAWSYGKVMSSLNPTTSDWGWGHFTMYGVHGIDDNPLGNPLGDFGRSCQACDKDADCGALGNICVRLNEGEKVCAVECLGGKGCPDDQVCRQYGSASTGYLRGMACVPKTLSCGVAPPPAPAPRVFKASGDLARKQTQVFNVPVGSRAKNIKVSMTGSGDADLYTGFSAPPTEEKWDCRPYKSTSTETCSHAAAKADTLQIMVLGYSQSSHFELTVTWD